VTRVVGLIIAGALVLGVARQIFYYSADPGVKDCSPIAGPVSGSAPAQPPDPAADRLPWAQRAGSINDVSCLNPTPVHGIVRVSEADDVRKALTFAARNGFKVSIAGARHSQGGHAFAGNAVVLDMRGLNRMSLDETTKVLTVQSGATWHDIQNHLHPRFAVKAMQSTDLFTVGGSISVNAHGMDHQAGSVGGTVRSMRVMLPDGTIHRVSRSEEPELFRLVVGGYGLFGVILEAEIEVTENAVYRSGREVIDYESFLAFFNDRIRPDPGYRLMYGHLSTSPASFLREMLVYTYRQTDGHRAPTTPLGDVSAVRLRRLVFNLSKLGSLPMRLKWWAEKNIEPMLETCPAGHDDGCLVSRNDPMHDSVPYLMNRLSGETDILHEYFIPMDQFTRFIDGLRRISIADRANILNASVRVVHREDNFLNYAPTDMFAIVLYVNQTTDATGTARMATLTRDLIDLSAEVGGRFFLPYQLHYSGEQLKRSYPDIEAFFRAKDTYDPQHILTNTFYEKYAPMVMRDARP
jgi:FAD/FMN-containing dehydrogenase